MFQAVGKYLRHQTEVFEKLQTTPAPPNANIADTSLLKHQLARSDRQLDSERQRSFEYQTFVTRELFNLAKSAQSNSNNQPNAQQGPDQYNDPVPRTPASSKKMMCEECEKATATHICKECEMCFCAACIPAVHSLGALVNHTISSPQCELCSPSSLGLLYCTDCEARYCEECSRRFHSKGARKNHSFQNQPTLTRSSLQELKTTNCQYPA